eukprot:CAMPEP_0185818356 /NCGR_PEP_ID=MMETSP1322-20130828/20519_1 /TAXON_ID=265543 /ORGANISM="Minutocellus polymorphus, Strain RCC2270" /LENGTH=94 /DNA_ID=CAMNT_0028515455 /DNA_START=113 /DNA_END=395 /DNA_ORIENTATION=-
MRQKRSLAAVYGKINVNGPVRSEAEDTKAMKPTTERNADDDEGREKMYNNTTIRVRRCASNAIDTPRLPNADTMAAIAITNENLRFDGWTKRYK